MSTDFWLVMISDFYDNNRFVMWDTFLIKNVLIKQI